jgi:hypothetical protein
MGYAQLKDWGKWLIVALLYLPFRYLLVLEDSYPTVSTVGTGTACYQNGFNRLPLWVYQFGFVLKTLPLG